MIVDGITRERYTGRVPPPSAKQKGGLVRSTQPIGTRFYCRVGSGYNLALVRVFATQDRRRHADAQVVRRRVHDVVALRDASIHLHEGRAAHGTREVVINEEGEAVSRLNDEIRMYTSLYSYCKTLLLHSTKISLIEGIRCSHCCGQPLRVLDCASKSQKLVR